MSFKSVPSTWCLEPPSCFRHPNEKTEEEWLETKGKYIAQAVKGMVGVNFELKDEFKRGALVKITRSWEGKLVLVSADSSIWKKSPGKCRVLLSGFWWQKNYPAWSCAVKQFQVEHAHMCSLDVALLKSRMAEIPLWFPEGEGVTDSWLNAFICSVETELRQRAELEREEMLPLYIHNAIRDSVQRVSICNAGMDCKCDTCAVAASSASSSSASSSSAASSDGYH